MGCERTMSGSALAEHHWSVGLSAFMFKYPADIIGPACMIRPHVCMNFECRFIRSVT